MFLFDICRHPCEDEKQILTEKLNNVEDELVTNAVHVSTLNTLKLSLRIYFDCTYYM